MGNATFKGGVHMYEGKELSKDTPVVRLYPKGEMVYPMSQHIGAPAKPVVAVGDSVLVGQKIGEAGGFVSANIISSASGVVKAIEERLTPAGVKALSVVVENDGNYTPAPGLGKLRDYTKMTKEEIREAIKEAGIVGMGGAGFPTHVKLTPNDDDKIEYIIMNASECEPYITADYRTLVEDGEKAINGMKIVLSLFKNAKGIIAIEDNKSDVAAELTERVKNMERIEVKLLKTKYPEGGERQLIYAVTGRKINSKMLPADAGCIVNNVATMVAVYDAVAENTPLTRRTVTVTGDAVAKPGNFLVPIGASYKSLVEAAGGYAEQPQKVISGGPMMGMALYTLDVPVTKTTSAILSYKEDPIADLVETACIHCGRCVKACPSGLVPQMMMKAAKAGDLEAFEKLDGMECTECGCCTYVCPASKRLTQVFKQTKRTIAANRKKK